MCKLFVTGLYVCFNTFVYSQVVNIQSGAPAKGLANIRSISQSAFSVNNNPAYLVQEEKSTTIGLGFYQMYNLAELNASNLLFAHRNKKNGLGVSLAQFGGEALKRQYLNISYAHAISNFSLGFRNSIQQISIVENGTDYFFNLDIGARYQLSSKLEAGILISNLTRPEIDDFEHFAPLYNIGLSYQASTSILLLAELQKTENETSNIALATQYNHENIFQIRIGVSPNTLLWTAGLGVEIKKDFNIDFAYQLQETLGSMYALTLTYTL